MNAKFKQIVDKNMMYKRKKEEIQNLYEETKILNDQITEEEFMSLTYPEMKKVLEAIHYCVDSDIYDRLVGIMEKKKERVYSQGAGAVYYPELNEITFLSKKEIKTLDRELGKHYRVGHTLPDSMRYRIGIPSARNYENETKKQAEIWSDVLDFLVEKGLGEELYTVKCSCGEIKGSVTQKEVRALPDICCDENTAFDLYCDECGDEIVINDRKDWETLIKRGKVIRQVRLKKEADKSYDLL